VHVLTKIFIVLVALLAVLLTPLVVVFAKNEGTFRERYFESTALERSTRADLAVAKDALVSAESRLQTERTQLQQQLSTLRSDVQRRESEVAALRNEVEQARAAQAGINASLATLAAAEASNAALVKDLFATNSELRETALAAQRRAVELDQVLLTREAELEVAVAARRALQEELQRTNDERDQALSEVSAYLAYIGPLPDAARDRRIGVAVDRNLAAVILNVRRNADATLAEINVGSRDGVREGWLLTISDGGTFIGNLRITRVDVNRSTGVVELEDRQGRGEVKAGQRATARIGG